MILLLTKPPGNIKPLVDSHWWHLN